MIILLLVFEMASLQGRISPFSAICCRILFCIKQSRTLSTSFYGPIFTVSIFTLVRLCNINP